MEAQLDLVMEAVRRKMAAKGLRVTEVAERMGIQHPTVSRYLSGKTTPMLSSFLALMAAVEIDCIELGRIMHWLEEADRSGEIYLGEETEGSSALKPDDQDRLYNALESLVEELLKRKKNNGE